MIVSSRSDPVEMMAAGTPLTSSSRATYARAATGRSTKRRTPHVGSRHPGIALAIAHANFPEDKNVLPALLLYLVVGALVAAPYLRWIRR